jgi:hypothetical protein
VPDAEAYKQPIQELLAREGIQVHTIEWIAPTLEDVFISSVKPREKNEELKLRIGIRRGAAKCSAIAGLRGQPVDCPTRAKLRDNVEE